MPDETTTVVDVRAHAAACGRLDCGHLARSTSRAVRRAVILYVAEGAGYRVDLDTESPEVAAVLGILREAQHPRPHYVRAGSRYVRQSPNEIVLPDVSRLRLTAERQIVFYYMWLGYSATEIADTTHRARETVRSHAGNLRRLTGAHDATSALVALALAGLI